MHMLLHSSRINSFEKGCASIWSLLKIWNPMEKLIWITKSLTAGVKKGKFGKAASRLKKKRFFNSTIEPIYLFIIWF